MLALILGGSGSGKSAFAEDVASMLGQKRLYLATMQPFGQEAQARIARHRLMRKDKGFDSIDCYTDLELLDIPQGYAVVLLECMSNLLANELYRPDANPDEVTRKILAGVERLAEVTPYLVIVSNDVGSDGDCYSVETLRYMQLLGELNGSLAQRVDSVTEVVCGIPIWHKGGGERWASPDPPKGCIP